MPDDQTNGVSDGHGVDGADDAELLARAATHHTHSLLHTALTHLHTHHTQHKLQWRNNVKAQLHHQYSLHRTAWSHWAALHNLEQLHSHHDTQSALHYSRQLLHTAWHAWLVVSRIPVAERALVVYAAHHGERVRLRRVYCRLQQAVHCSQQHKQQTVRRCAHKWRKVVKRKLTQSTVLQQLCTNVQAYHERQTVERWQSFSRHVHLLDTCANQLQQQHSTHLMRYALHIWKHNQLYNREHASLIKADKLCYQKCAGYAIQQLKQHSIERVQYEQLEHSVARTCNSRMLSDAVAVWTQTRRQFHVVRHNTDTADQVNRRAALHAALNNWQQSLTTHFHHKHMLHNADQHCLQHVVRQWYSIAQVNVHRHLDERRAKRHNYLTIVYTVFAAWSTPVVAKLEVDEALAAHAQPLVREYTHQVFSLWYNNMRDNHTERIQLGNSILHYQQRRLGSTIQRMHYTAQHNKASTHKRALAVKHANKQLKRRVLLQWDMHTYKQHIQHDTDQSLILRATMMLNNSMVRSCYTLWRYLASKRQVERRQVRTAEAHRARHHLQHGIQSFQHTVNVHHQHMADRYTAKQQCDRQLLKAALTQWLHHLSDRRAELDKHIRALTHWSTSACKYVWRRWLIYHTEQRHQKQRQQRALAQYRRNMLVDGCVHWLEAATQVHAQQVDAVRQQHSEMAARVYAMVERVAYHWYNRTFAGGDTHGAKPLLRHVPRKSNMSARPSLLPLNNILTASGKLTAASSRSVTSSPSKRRSLPVRQRAQPRDSLALGNSAESTTLNTSAAVSQHNAVAEQELYQIEQQIQQYAAEKQQYADDVNQYQQLASVLQATHNVVPSPFTAVEYEQILQQYDLLADAVQAYEAQKVQAQGEIKQLLQRLHDMTDVA